LANGFQYHHAWRTAEMGFAGFSHSSNSKPCMSALGQKQTLGKMRPMSALPPKADIVPSAFDVRKIPAAASVIFTAALFR
jgi:hypothetical protein